ncbi:3-mercaptopyruvate sulfurtransferase [Polymorphobacter sp. PAMC 29334]|uniref:3-mercaptopyruvate sulfurtransferase n=1 Tax=Polymorphobacter sp. PAMC 29334 TaxID=2862331 RepID=UPI001C7797E1|nr:3-mercaptopyruvate sulfurtransferase [Polymorphobacter sp. PAMC 29334]QYE35177.1 3-mercaptopyruvate sulfurtransferase [Polymorphobacter sp. PAMC 29334]
MTPLVTTEWLAAELGANDLRIVDATIFLPETGRTARAEFETGHIPGAVFMDLDELVDTGNPVPNMLPSPEKFASRMQALGLGDGSRIVVYDNSPFHSSARAWWMLNLFGAHEVAILDGGFAKWQAEGRPTESGKPVVRHRHFTIWGDTKGVRTMQAMIDNLRTKAEQVVDARPAGRFAGTDPEPREGMRSGHIPGSRNLPSSDLFNADGTWKQGTALRAAFTDAGIDIDKPLVTTCGSGITAAVLSFGAALLGAKDVALYDGSWSEWGASPTAPVVTGAA